jgi:hypothetical protein
MTRMILILMLIGKNVRDVLCSCCLYGGVHRGLAFLFVYIVGWDWDGPISTPTRAFKKRGDRRIGHYIRDTNALQ